MHQLSDRQIEIMRETYPGFKDADNKRRHLQAEREIYKQQPGYRPFAEEQNNNDRAIHQRGT